LIAHKLGRLAVVERILKSLLEWIEFGDKLESTEQVSNLLQQSTT
jgi:hypothetical protein